MRKQIDSVHQFTTLRAALLSEREDLRKRLQQLDAALAGAGAVSAPPASRKSAPRSMKAPAKSTRASNTMSIREAVARVTAKKALSVREIVEAVQKIGYKFTSSDPVNSVGAYLYGAHGRKLFKRADGKFSPAK
jgi:hypothetical protein